MTLIMDLLKKYWIYIAGAAVGALAGYLYWYYIGCLSGTCPLKSTPTVSIILYSMIGLYLSAGIQKIRNRK